MIMPEQTLEFKSTTEEKARRESIGQVENISKDNQRIESNQKYKTIFNCSYSQMQE